MKKIIILILAVAAFGAVASEPEPEIITMDPVLITVDVHHVHFTKPEVILAGVRR